jgi:leucyl aminopeptidase
MIPTSTRVSIGSGTAVANGADAVAVFIAEKGKAIDEGALSSAERKAVARLMAAGVARGKAREVAAELVENGAKKSRHMMVVGIGRAEKVTAEIIRQAAAALAKAARRRRVKNVAVVVPDVEKISTEAAAEAIVNGFLLASFKYEEHKGTASKKTEDEESAEPVKVTLVANGKEKKAIDAAINRGRVVADGQNFARTIASRPGNEINPPALAKVAQELAREVGLRAPRIMDEKELKRLGMGGILAVGSGSTLTPPRMIVLEYRPKSGSNSRGKNSRPVLVVGKAITFDTGGISIKPAEKMGRMVFDKCGAMAVLGLMYAVAKLKPPIGVVGILSSAENHISESAYRPGDIIRMYNGVTVEVTNTDAEGRLVLGDALSWGIETYKPSAVLDLATLTGGVVVALGKTMAGVMGNSNALYAELQAAADRAGEKIWRLPIGDDQRDLMKSDFADIVNSGPREAHPLQGGAFLSYFVPQDNSVPWMHLDIAGVADTEKELPYYAKGATGWGVRTLVEWVAARAAEK